MGKKHGKGKKKTKTVLSLAEFNEDAGIGGVDPELSALPSAPKAAEDWEAEGGRPEYNSRGYKERTAHREQQYDNDVDFQERDWARKGPLEEQEGGNSFGAGGPDRDWGDMRRGPLDTGAESEAVERDWNGMRRGPVDSAFEAQPERNWGVRKGPIEAETSNVPRVISDDNWGSARKQTVDAEFPDQQQERDWAVRKGPVEAQNAPKVVDWSARKGPVESEVTAQEKAERDWSQRKGPIEAVIVPVRNTEADWSGARRGPLEVEPEQKPEESKRDWSARRGPVEPEVEAAQKGVRAIDFGDVRRGARLQQLEKPVVANAKDVDVPRRGQALEKDSWRRDVGTGSGRKDRTARERPASTGHDSPHQERDWGAARRTQPLKERAIRLQNGGRVSDVSEAADVTQVDTEANGNHYAHGDDWTTVRGASQKNVPTGANRRHSGRDVQRGFSRRAPREFRAERPAPVRAPLEPQNKTTSSPLTPVASAVTDV